MPAVGVNGVRDARAVGKNGAGGERHHAAVERERAPAGSDKFDATVGKIIAGHEVIAPHLLLTAAHDRERPTVGGPQVEEVAAGRHDLPRDECRQRLAWSARWVELRRSH